MSELDSVIGGPVKVEEIDLDVAQASLILVDGWRESTGPSRPAAQSDLCVLYRGIPWAISIFKHFRTFIRLGQLE